MTVLDQLEQFEEEALASIHRAEDLEEIQAIRVKYLGREGLITGILRGIGDLPPDQRADVGQRGNAVKQAIESALEEAEACLERARRRAQFEAQRLDVTAPGKPWAPGNYHPLGQTFDQVLDILVSMGYAIVRGPEVEKEWYNFSGLNIQDDHPARDMQDSFYVTEDVVLRSQTSPIQLRHMQAVAPEIPVRIVGPGRTYRRDTEDMSHSPVFHQCEALLIDQEVTFGQLRWTLTAFARRLFGPSVDVRFRPSHFPFTEPSAEVDISCMFCHGQGCSTCKGSGFLEILGAGMVHPQVLINGGYDPDLVSGFAFGMGIERLTMLKYGISDLRLLYRNDTRFLAQF